MIGLLVVVSAPSPLAAQAAQAAQGPRVVAPPGGPALCGGRAPTILGTDKDDVLIGTPGPDVISSGNGNDEIDGRGGDDIVCGGNGTDEIYGGVGADTLYGDNGPDLLVAEDSLGTLDGGNGPDTCAQGLTRRSCESTRDEPVPAAVKDSLIADVAAELGSSAADFVPAELESNGARVTVFGTDLAGNVTFGAPAADSALRNNPGQLSEPVEVEVAAAAGDYAGGVLSIPVAAAASTVPDDQLMIGVWRPELSAWLPAAARTAVERDSDGAKIASVAVRGFSIFALFRFTDWLASFRAINDCGRAGAGNLDLALVLDSSGSMQSNDPENQRLTAAKSLIDALGVNDRVSVIDFDSQGRVLHALNEDKSAAKAAVDRVDAVGGTDIAAGVSLGLLELIRALQRSPHQVLVLLTDGEGAYSESLTQSAIREKIKIFTVGLGSAIDAPLLNGIAAATGGEYFAVGAASGLDDAFDDIGGEVGATCPPAPPTNVYAESTSTGMVSVSWQSPYVSDEAVSSYTVRAVTGTGSSGPTKTVAATNDAVITMAFEADELGATPYRFVVTARSAVGKSLSSRPSNEVVGGLLIEARRLEFDSTLPQFLAHKAARRGSLDSKLNWTDDGCSGPTYKEVEQVFAPACERHDFGYRNFGGKRLSRDTGTKIAVDDKLLHDGRFKCQQYGDPRIKGGVGVKVRCSLVAEWVRDAMYTTEARDAFFGDNQCYKLTAASVTGRAWRAQVECENHYYRGTGLPAEKAWADRLAALG